MAEPHNLTVDECLALLKDGSLRSESIAEEMECAGVSRPQPAEVHAAREVLAKLQTEAVAQTAGLEGPDPRALAREIAALPAMLALALTHAAGRAARQEVLVELAAAKDRTLGKEATRGARARGTVSRRRRRMRTRCACSGRRRPRRRRPRRCRSSCPTSSRTSSPERRCSRIRSSCPGFRRRTTCAGSRSGSMK